MEIVINHLTRMRPGYICVAGVDQATGEHVRPVLRRANLSRALLASEGGAFDIAAIVDLGVTEPSGARPETEDHTFAPDNLVTRGDLTPTKFWRLLQRVSNQRLREIFGDELEARGNGLVVDENSGVRSLGCLAPAEAPRLSVNRWGKIRAEISDGELVADLSVTDLRLYEADQVTPREETIAAIQRRIDDGTAVILSVGLARAFIAQGDTARRHWLQLNNVHLEDDPTFGYDAK